MNDRLLGAVLVGLAAGLVAWLVRRGIDKVVPPRRSSTDTSSSEGTWSAGADTGDSGGDSSDGGDSGGGGDGGGGD